MNLDPRLIGYARRKARDIRLGGEIRMDHPDGTLSVTVRVTRRGTAVCTVSEKGPFLSEVSEEFVVGPKDWSPRRRP